jgi:hypothetical protein
LTFQFAVAGLGSALPAVSVAITENVCDPFFALPSKGELHEAGVAPSSEHLKVAGSFAEKEIENFADLPFVLIVALG